MDGVENEFDWTVVCERLLSYAVRRLGQGRLADAEEITQQAIEEFFDPGHYDWEPSDGADLDGLLRDLGSRVNGLVANDRAKRRRRHDLRQLDRNGPKWAPSPEERVVSADQVQEAVTDVLDRVGDDELASEVIMKMAEGYEHAGDIAAALTVDKRAVYNARRRLGPHIDAVRERLGRDPS